MKIKRLLSLFLFGLVILLSITVIAEDNFPNLTEADYDISVNVPVTDIYPQDEVYFTFDLSTPVSVYAIETEVAYDTEYFSFSKIEYPQAIADETNIEIIDNSDGRIIYALTRVDNKAIELDDLRMLTFTFIAKESGTSQIKIEKIKVVKEDMSYQDITPLQKVVTVNVLTKTNIKPSKPSYNGGGGGGGMISVSGGNNTTAQKSEPIIFPDEEPIIDEKTEFTDIFQVEWAKDAIEDMARRGIIQGTDKNEFSPLRPVTRAEIAKMLVIAFSINGQADAPISFSDVKEDEWYHSYIKNAYSLGIINGKSEEEFEPESPASREEFAAMLARCISVKSFNLTQEKLNINYTDEWEISDYAVGYVDMLYMSGIMSGDENGSFRPKDNLTRAEAAVGIYRLLSNVMTEAGEVADNE